MQFGVQAQEFRYGSTIVTIPVQRTFFTLRLRSPRMLVIGIGFYYFSWGV